MRHNLNFVKREFYYQDDRSNKFWTIELHGTDYSITNGRVGASLRETRKQFLTEQEAKHEFDKQISAKLRKGYTEGIPPPHEKTNWESIKMSEDVFWRIITLFNWKRTGDDEAVIEPAVAVLAKMQIDNILEFENILSEKLFALDTELHAREIGEDAWIPEKHFSPDLFLYARCVVVANGRSFFDSVVSDPVRMPKDMEFESLLRVAPTAFERKTGSEFDHMSRVSYESFSNQVGWSSLKDA
jgi:predicted DNA-binding WGR domain protein